MTTGTFKAAINALAEKMIAAADEHGEDPDFDWRGFAAKAVYELPPYQFREIARSNDSAFQMEFWRALNRKAGMKMAFPGVQRTYDA